MQITTQNAQETTTVGQKLGKAMSGGEFIELLGDLGSGKTTLLKGLAKGLGITQSISSPTFTISRIYEAGTKSFHHFDFYRIDSSDIVALELTDAANDPSAIVAVEWAEHVGDALPKDRLTVKLEALSENERKVTLTANGEKHLKLLEQVQ